MKGTFLLLYTCMSFWFTVYCTFSWVLFEKYVFLKTLGQNAKNPRYNGAIHCALQTFKYEGIQGFYKGLLSPMCAQVTKIVSLNYSQIYKQAFLQCWIYIHNIKKIKFVIDKNKTYLSILWWDFLIIFFYLIFFLQIVAILDNKCHL